MKKRPMIIIVLFLTAGIIAGFFFYRKYSSEIKIPYYDDLNMEDIHLSNDSSKYALKNGKVFRDKQTVDENKEKVIYERVLRLAFFYQLMKEDPLLASPDLEVKSMDEAIKRMKQINDHAKELTKVQQSVNPVGFLQSFADSSLAYQNFLGGVSEENAQKLNDKMQLVVDNYLTDAQGIKDIFDLSIEKKQENRKFLFLGGITSSNFAIMSHDMALIIENGNLLKEKLKKRQDCLNLSASFCQRPLLNKSKPILEKEELFVPQFLSKEELNIRGEATGPFVVHSACWGNGLQPHFIYNTQRCEKNGAYCFEWSQLADDTYFAKLANTKMGEFLKSKGVEFSSQSPTATYGCNNLEYKPELENLNYMFDRYKNNRIFEQILKQQPDLSADARKIIEEGREIEEYFFAAQYPSDRQLHQLADYYGYAYGYFSKNNLLQNDIRDELLKRHIQADEKMANFSLIMNRASYHLENFENGTGNSADSAKFPEYFFATRTAYSIFFLNFSPFIWQLNQKDQYIDVNAELRNNFVDRNNLPPVIDYKTAVSVFGKQTLENWRNTIKNTDIKNELHHRENEN